MFLKSILILVVLLPVSSILAAFDNPQQIALQHPNAAQKPEVPTRPLVWGELNILHTTDTHGWLGSYSSHVDGADWGDWAEFVTRMRAKAEAKGVDLLVVDTGDLHDGTGLSNGNPDPNGINGRESNAIFSMVDYDLLTVGNHELYHTDVAEDTFENFVPQWKGKYLATNVNITVDDLSRPMGSKFRRFVTPRRNLTVTSFGILHDFALPARGTNVMKMADLIQQDWFLQEIAVATDVFLLLGHMALNDENWDVVVSKIREHHPQVPVLIFAGHAHVRDCRRPDKFSVGIASGRFMETVGFLSANVSRKTNFNYNRRYIDVSISSYDYHTNRGLSQGHNVITSENAKIKKEIGQVRSYFGLDELYGLVPHNYYINRVPAGHKNSLHTLLLEHVLPKEVVNKDFRSPVQYLVNSGSMRYNLYKGPFTKDNLCMVSPFSDNFSSLVVTQAEASNISENINRFTTRFRATMMLTNIEPPHEENILSGDADRSYGHVTLDSCRGRGDDLEHKGYPYHEIQEFLTSPTPQGDLITLVFVKYITPFLLEALDYKYSVLDVHPYSNTTQSEVFKSYARKFWNSA